MRMGLGRSVYCAGVCWIRIKCGILFQGRDGEGEGTDPNNLDRGVSLFSTTADRMYRTLALTSSLRQAALLGEEKGPWRREGEPADNSLIFMCARGAAAWERRESVRPTAVIVHTGDRNQWLVVVGGDEKCARRRHGTCIN